MKKTVLLIKSLDIDDLLFHSRSKSNRVGHGPPCGTGASPGCPAYAYANRHEK